MRKQFRHLRTLEEAINVLETLAIDPTPETIELEPASGRVLAESVTATMDVPGFDRSIMDGYAVRAADTIGAYDDKPVGLAYAGKVVPGETPTVSVATGEAVEIATGAVIPSGANAVVKVEDTTTDGDVVSVTRPVAPQEHIMSRGADIAAGETVLRRGDRLDARRIGLLAALGVDTVTVASRPTVGVISTGAEIVRPGDADELDPGEIYDINSFSMASAIEDAGALATVYPHAEDDYAVIRDTFERAAAECDLVVSSGSTSASAEDVVYRIVEDAGELLLHGIAVKPGKPTVFGRIDDTPVLGMPGNPISALMNFRLFVRPMLRWALGQRGGRPGTVQATMSVDVDSVGGRTQLSPVGLIDDSDHGLLAYPVGKGSGAITSLADADGYLTIPAGVHFVAEGEPATVTLLDDGVTHPDVLCVGEFCPVVDAAVDAVEADVRWLAEGGLDGLRKLRDGIADLAVVGLPRGNPRSVGPDDVTVLRGYDRRLGWLYRSRPDLDTDATVATLPRQTGVAGHLDAIVDDHGWSIAVQERPSPAGLVRAVMEGTVEAAFVDEASITGHGADLTFEPVDWTPMDLYLSTPRREKPGVSGLIDAIGECLDSNPAGIRTDEAFGEPIGSG